MSGFDWWGWDFGDCCGIGGDFLGGVQVDHVQESIDFQGSVGFKVPPF